MATSVSMTPAPSGSLDNPNTTTTGPFGGYSDTLTAQTEGLDALKQASANTQDVPGIWQQGIKNFDTQTQAGLGALRQQAATALAGNKGMLGGGRGLVLSNQSALQRGTAEGQYLSEAGAQRVGLQQQGNQALQQAAQQRYQTSKDTATMIDTVNANRQAKINDALTQAAAITDSMKGTIWTTDSDKQKMAAAISQKILSQETDPAVRQAVQNYIDSLTNGSLNIKGTIDS